METNRTQLLVIGSGPGGYSAAFRAADLGLQVTLVERFPVLGGVCLNVGCIPSKALLHIAHILDEAKALHKAGIRFAAPQIDLEALRLYKASVVQKLNDGLAAMAKARRVEVIQGVARFKDLHTVEIAHTTGPDGRFSGATTELCFEQAIIAAGSRALRLPGLPDDPRIIDSTGALALPSIPQRMLVIGAGIIGLEMGTVYAALGASVDVVEASAQLFSGADEELTRAWLRVNQRLRIMRETRAERIEPRSDGLWVTLSGKEAIPEPQRYDLVLVAVGRKPRSDELALERAGITPDRQGFIPVDHQQRTCQPHIFAIGDIARPPLLAHKAVHEGHIAAEVAAGHKRAFDALVIPSVAYTDPELAWVGMSEAEAKKAGRALQVARFPWAASGRALAAGRSEGLTKLLFDAETRRLLGGAIVGINAGELIGEVALAIEMGAEIEDIAHTIHPHPTLCESVGLAAEAALGICTDLPPLKRS